MKALILSIVLFLITGCASESPQTIQSVLIVGDSISIGYTPFVEAKLNGKSQFSVQRIRVPTMYGTTDNARNSYFTRNNIAAWVDQYKPNVVTWNNGIWNTKIVGWDNHGEPQENLGTSSPQYEDDIIHIATYLKSKGIRVLFFTSTELDPNTAQELDHDKLLAFNEIAKQVLPGLGVEVYDLYAVSVTIPQLRSDGCHYYPAGSAILGDFVVKALKGEVR